MDLGLEIDKAIQSVKEDDKSKNKKRRSRRKPNSSKKTPSSDGERSNQGDHEYDAGGLDFYFKNPTEALLRNFSNRLASDGEDDGETTWEDQDGFLLAEEYDSDSSSSSSSSEESYSSDYRTRIARDASHNRNGQGLTYKKITGNVPPEQLSIADLLNEDEMGLLTAGENYGVEFVGDLATDKKIKKKKKKKGVTDVVVVKHEFHGMSATGREEEDAEADPEDSLAPSTLFLTVGDHHDDKLGLSYPMGDVVLWPPPAIVDDPPPPTAPPPRDRRTSLFRNSLRATRHQSGGRVIAAPNLLSRSLSFNMPGTSHGAGGSSVSSQRNSNDARSRGGYSSHSMEHDRDFDRDRDRDHEKDRLFHPPPPLKKQASKVRATTMALSKGLLAKLYSPSNRAGPRESMQRGDRFITGKDIPYIIPPPPEPRMPPIDFTEDEQVNMDRELIGMFVEDLRSTLLKLEAKRNEKTDRVSTLQAEIETIDDEIAELLQPKDSERHVESAITSQLKSVTSGKIFRVEKYNT
mmetsp:Transcript_17751/g.35010  ORF Transcript_17751/g.35010 Transcript_17751/m.35010 type:complete len:520 (-) Transcript_17751:117-1676(-)|eukprot:CAMPEP_0171556220 /NCGR_PEP_ID=MMETSP0960-20121227/10590_1 /TAXON_ID=87120 /ORGANISM="Aurantiochytrium limacinum, Strain ATCCMYA-1381" /LENGTH=519 /DNA_ID=CAMNT_0012106425 /DNA_START=207 /DNA_END=1766 /DNA_ORIENTATION=+